MNDPLLSAAKFEELTELAMQAATGFEKAAVFAAARALNEQFHDSDAGLTSYAMEKATQATWHICALVGFDITNQLPREQHRSGADIAISSLKDALRRQE